MVRCSILARDTVLGSPEIETLLRSLSNTQVRHRHGPTRTRPTLFQL